MIQTRQQPRRQQDRSLEGQMKFRNSGTFYPYAFRVDEAQSARSGLVSDSKDKESAPESEEF